MNRAQMIADLVAAHSRLSLLTTGRDWTWSKAGLEVNGQPTYTLSTPGAWPATYVSTETDPERALVDVWQRTIKAPVAEVPGQQRLEVALTLQTCRRIRREGRRDPTAIATFERAVLSRLADPSGT